MSDQKSVTVSLENPIKRGETSIAEVSLRKPKAGELRGLSMAQIIQSDVNTLITLIPRVSNPPLIVQEVEELETEDFTVLADAIVGFFMSRAQRQQVETLLAT